MKINKLTKEQESLVPIYLDKWLKVGRRTETIDREKAKSAIDFLYTDILKMAKPKHYFFVDSPMACQITLGLLEGLAGKKPSPLDSQLYSQLYSQLGSQLGSQLIYDSRSNWNNSYYFYYDFILNELFSNKKKDFSLFTEFLEKSKDYHHIYLSPEVALFSDFPEQIHVNKEGELDFDKGMALKYRDGDGIYALEGKIIDERSPVGLALAGIIE